jgi:hypothetical protein
MDGFAGDPVVRVVDGFLDEPDQVPVMKRIDHVPAILARIHEPAETEFGKVLAHHGTRNAGLCSQFGHGFWSLGELPEQVQPRGFGEHPQRSGGRVQQFRPGRDRMD